MAKAIGGGRELNGHEREILVMKKGKLRLLDSNAAVLLFEVRKNLMDNLLAGDRGQEGVQHNRLIVPAHHVLHLVKLGRSAIGPGQVIDDAIVESQHGGVKLGHDHIFVIARITNQGASPAALRTVTRKIACPLINFSRVIDTSLELFTE